MFQTYCKSALVSAADTEEMDTTTAAVFVSKECSVSILQTNCASRSGENIRKNQLDFSGASLIFAVITKVSIY